MRYVVFIACVILVILTVGCTTQSPQSTKPTSPPITVTTVQTTAATIIPTTKLTTLPTTKPTTKPTPNQKVTAAEAQAVVQDTLRIVGSISPITDMQGNKVAWPKLPNGVDFPTDGQAGSAELITMGGIPVYDVPVFSNGKKIGDMYVKQIRGDNGDVEFYSSSKNSPSGYSAKTY